MARWLPSLFKQDVRERNNAGMLTALNAKAKSRGEIFQGADARKKAANRRRNKAARAARREHRR